ncbi:SDR family oxidoreductase [Pseudomonas sp. MWU16-30317]|uniref:UDP-glucose 4-epimerase family protein n=1 Tax=Pseudomonas sp. MWU16-30317 TaxID=2878095 RepID=UPI0031F85E82
MSILVTGGTGFVGATLLESFANSDCVALKACVRTPPINPSERISYVRVPSIDARTDWSQLLPGVNVVVHTAARVHVMDPRAQDDKDQYFEINVAGTIRLAEQAAAAGVKRFIFLSSIKVNGEGTTPDRMFTADDPPAPMDAYAVSKAEAETRLLRLASRSAMEVVIIRPVLVYGPGVKANFLSMMRWLDRGIPLPLGSIKNLRSLVAVGNLVDFIRLCAVHPGAANQIFLVSDGEDLSTSDLLRRTARSLSVTPRLFRFPADILGRIAKLFGKTPQLERLAGSLQVDITKNKLLLGWVPPIPVDEALQQTASFYKKFQS